jgi:hypothetical protein
MSQRVAAILTRPQELLSVSLKVLSSLIQPTSERRELALLFSLRVSIEIFGYSASF